jgi:translation elongation factor EF-Ts
MKKVTAKMILELCTYSGKDVMVCKRALVKAEGDMSTAKKIVGKKYVCAVQTPPTPSKKKRKPKKS